MSIYVPDTVTIKSKQNTQKRYYFQYLAKKDENLVVERERKMEHGKQELGKRVKDLSYWDVGT